MSEGLIELDLNEPDEDDSFMTGKGWKSTRQECVIRTRGDYASDVAV